MWSCAEAQSLVRVLEETELWLMTQTPSQIVRYVEDAVTNRDKAGKETMLDKAHKDVDMSDEESLLVHAVSFPT